MKKIFIIIGGLWAVPARATDVATTQAYVDTAANALQDNLPAKTSDKVVTYTTTAGTTGEREIKTTLGNESSNQADNGLSTVGTVNASIDNKQKKLTALPATNVVTYTGTNEDGGLDYGGVGLVTTTPIYDSTINTFDNGLVTAKTLNDAIIAGVNAEVTPIDTPKGKLWRINRTAPKVLPTTANLPANGGNPHGACYKPVAPTAEILETTGDCTSAMRNSMAKGDWGIVLPYDTGITYDTTCGETYCGKEVHGISACGPYIRRTTDVPVSREYWDELDAAYEASKDGTLPSGAYCYCKLINPATAGNGWVIYGARGNSTKCANDCAQHCANHSRRVEFRGAVFGATPLPVTE